MYEIFEHTADLGLRVRARTFDELLADAARGLYAVLVVNPESIGSVEERTVVVPAAEDGSSGDSDEAEAREFLLFDWLSELLFLFESEHFLGSQFQLERSGRQLTAHVRGERMDRQRHQMDHEVKAVTYHALSVVQQDGRWRAEVILDI